jgi:ribosomal protein S14
MVSIRQVARKDYANRRKVYRIERARQRYRFLKIHATRVGFLDLQPEIHQISRVKNTCLMTGSSRSIYTKNLRLSRHAIKRYFSFVKGLQNSSW